MTEISDGQDAPRVAQVPEITSEDADVSASRAEDLAGGHDALETALARELAIGISAALAPLPVSTAAQGGRALVTILTPQAVDHELEDGIAEVFAALHANRDEVEDGAGNDAQRDDSGLADDDFEADAITFRLLGELDRLWHRSAA